MYLQWTVHVHNYLMINRFIHSLETNPGGVYIWLIVQCKLNFLWFCFDSVQDILVYDFFFQDYSYQVSLFVMAGIAASLTVEQWLLLLPGWRILLVVNDTLSGIVVQKLPQKFRWLLNVVNLQIKLWLFLYDKHCRVCKYTSMSEQNVNELTVAEYRCWVFCSAFKARATV